jgi:hypothetical protein
MRRRIDSIKIHHALATQIASKIVGGETVSATGAFSSQAGAAQPLPTSFAKVSRRPMVRLNTGASAVESLSRTK